MVIDVLLEPLSTAGYRASSIQPWPESVEAATREEALTMLGKKIESQWKSGNEIVQMQLSLPQYKLPAWPGDEFTEDWLAAIEEVRLRADRELLEESAA